MARIFLVEDDCNIQQELIKLLQKYGYECESAKKFDAVPAEIQKVRPDLVLLDLNLPQFDGFYICREIRKNSRVPIIIVTSRDSEVDELMSINLGADDFVTKPYNSQILLARISSVIRRCAPSAQEAELECAGVVLHLARSSVSYNGKETELTKNEMQILHLLLASAGEVVSREDIMNSLWQSDEFVDDNTLTVNINRLRRKLDSIGVREGFLTTRRGQGYMVEK